MRPKRLLSPLAVAAFALLMLTPADLAAQQWPRPDVDSLTDCEILWAKISNADIRAADAARNSRTAERRSWREKESGLKQTARELECSSRPVSIPRRLYPEVDELPDPKAPEYSVSWYRIAYQSCKWDPEQVYGEAGTKDPEAAAEWLAGQVVADPRGQRGYYRGCFDALEQKPSRHPRAP